MRRLLTLFVCILTFTVAVAQSTNSIIIYQDSFRAVNTDALTGLSIDGIAKDHSLRPCARIKMKINRMTTEEINGLQVVPITNNDVIRCTTSQYESGLIVELTAKSQTRFYLKHDKFGMSNEVTLNLEANKEYYLDVEMVQQFPVTIATNVADADIYLDDQFVGKSNDQYYLIVEDMLAGSYKLTVKYGGRSYSKQIIVTSASVYFKQEVDISSSSMQYLTVVVSPKNALVEIDNIPIETPDGRGKKILGPGTYRYKVSAFKHYEKSGTVTMSGEKVELNIALDPQFGYLKVESNKQTEGAIVYVDNLKIGTLPFDKEKRLDSQTHTIKIVKSLYLPYEQTITVQDGKTTTIKPQLQANFAKVTITSKDGGEIWIDSELRATGKWEGNLEVGNHAIECRKASHTSRTATLSVPNTSNVEYSFPALEPICGTVDIDCNIIGATITIDGEKVGTTPLVKSDVLVGKHTVTISKEGYKTVSEAITVVANKLVSIKPSLSKVSTPSQSYTNTTSSSSTSKSYNSSLSRNYYNSTTTSSSTTSTKTNTKSDFGNLVQFGIGVDYGFGTKQMVVAIPVELRIGRASQFINFFVGERFTSRSTLKDDKSSSSISSSSTEHNPELSFFQFSTLAKLRINLIRAKSSSSSALFFDAGAMYNVNPSATYKTGSIAYNSSTYNNNIVDSYTRYTVDDITHNTISTICAVGWGGKLMEIALFYTQDLSPNFSTAAMANHILEHPNSSGAPTMLNQSRIATKFAECKFNIGASIKVYFGSGILK